jgi:hypothetical protein
MKTGRMIFWVLLIVVVLFIILFLGTQDFSVKASPPFISHIASTLHLGDTQTIFLPVVTKGEEALPLQQP